MATAVNVKTSVRFDEIMFVRRKKRWHAFKHKSFIALREMKACDVVEICGDCGVGVEASAAPQTRFDWVLVAVRRARERMENIDKL